jgi:hypothetical protein
VLAEELDRGAHLLEVRTTDMFGQVYESRRLLRVVDSTAAGARRRDGIR